jgi:multiple sugar transport system permease protein
MESKNNWKAWLYLAPILILLAVFTFYPIINTFYVSFLKDYSYMTGTHKGFTFENYLAVLTPYSKFGTANFELVMRTALPNTLLITIITVPISIILSMIIALALNSIKVLKKLFQTVFFMPYVTNAIAIGMVFSVIFSTDYGIFNFLFGLGKTAWIFKSPSSDAVNYWNALFAICFYIVWHSLPYKILIFLGGLQNIDQQYYDAAKIDSSPKWKTTLKVTVPLLSPQILYMMITSFIGSFKEYSSVIGLFGAEGGSFDVTTGPSSMKTMVFFIYDQVADNKVHIASAAAVILFAIIMLFTLVQNKVSSKRVHY